jgi:hypothetical protein
MNTSLFSVMHARSCGFAKRAVVGPNSREQRQRYRAVNRSGLAIALFGSAKAISALPDAVFAAFGRGRVRLTSGTFAATTRGATALSALMRKI